ncbi:hypothetical protein WHZ76_14980 [Citrobacter portucalensis]|uniref:hypothetical protein n=1 Tax=Citrobacter portucalensis TaxID=1639133 RepID=UPI00339BD44F
MVQVSGKTEHSVLVFWRAVSNVSIPTQRSSTLFMANSHCQMKATAVMLPTY